VRAWAAVTALLLVFFSNKKNILSTPSYRFQAASPFAVIEGMYIPLVVFGIVPFSHSHERYTIRMPLIKDVVPFVIDAQLHNDILGQFHMSRNCFNHRKPSNEVFGFTPPSGPNVNSNASKCLDVKRLDDCARLGGIFNGWNPFEFSSWRLPGVDNRYHDHRQCFIRHENNCGRFNSDIGPHLCLTNPTRFGYRGLCGANGRFHLSRLPLRVALRVSQGSFGDPPQAEGRDCQNNREYCDLRSGIMPPKVTISAIIIGTIGGILALIFVLLITGQKRNGN